MGSSGSKSSLAHFEPAKFAGKWYLIGRYPGKHEAGITSATFEYTIIPNTASREMMFEKTCHVQDANVGIPNPQNMWGLRVARIEKGIVKMHGETGMDITFENSKKTLKTNVLWTDYDNLAFIGAGKDQYWILCRRPTVTEDELALIKHKTEMLGYQTKYVEMTPNGADGQSVHRNTIQTVVQTQSYAA